MKAIVIRDFGRPLQYEDVETPQPNGDEVLVRVRAVGVCATDIKLAAGKTQPPPPLPHIPGHEVAGEVVTEAAGLSAGQRVACHIMAACGRCRECRRGYPVFCIEGKRLGLDYNGGMAEFVSVPASTLIPVDDSVDYEFAAVAMDSITTPWNAVHEVGKVQTGEFVLIVGVGGLGGNAVQLAAAAGARVAAVDVNPAALEYAMSVGAEIAVRPDDEKAIRSWSGNGVSMAIELSGRRDGFQLAGEQLEPGGRLVCCGYSPGVEYGLDSARLVLDNIKILGSRNVTLDTSRSALNAIATGKVVPRIADRLPLSEAGNALRRLGEGGVAGRIVLTP